MKKIILVLIPILLYFYSCGGSDNANSDCTQHIGVSQGRTYYWYEGDCDAVIARPMEESFIIQFDFEEERNGR